MGGIIYDADQTIISNIFANTNPYWKRAQYVLFNKKNQRPKISRQNPFNKETKYLNTGSKKKSRQSFRHYLDKIGLRNKLKNPPSEKIGCDVSRNPAPPHNSSENICVHWEIPAVDTIIDWLGPGDQFSLVLSRSLPQFSLVLYRSLPQFSNYLRLI
jgi:hypothetical protein